MYNKQDPESIQKMFATIAKHYDRTNFLLSFGLYRKWNSLLVKHIGEPLSLLDLCAGTGDIALTFLKKNENRRATLLDFCPEMLQVARAKGAAFSTRFETVVADAQKIPIPDRAVEAITIAYGIRNIKEPLETFHECHRVLQTKGVLGILELTRPHNPLLHLGHTLYLRTSLPLLGKLGGKNRDAYSYLAKSISKFSSPTQLASQIKKAGFSEIKKIPLMGGVATILLCYKN